MFEPGFFSFQDRGDEKSKDLLKLPSKTRQELLLRMGCDCTRWPAEDGKVESRLEPSGAAGVIGNISDITEDLIQHAREEEKGYNNHVLISLLQHGRVHS